MATIGTKPNLVDVVSRTAPDGSIAAIAELLNQTNEVTNDIPWIEGNLDNGHRVSVRTGLPSTTWRKLNAGVPNTKSKTQQITEATAMLHARGEIDKDVANQNGNRENFRITENMAHIEAMNEEFVATLFYGDSTTAPEEFLGLAPRYNSLTATNGGNIIDAAGTQSDNSSIWLIGFAEDTICGIYPKGTAAGLTHLPIMDASGDGCSIVEDGSGNKYRALVDEFQWKVGIAVKDWRYAVRIANIDISNLVGESSQADLIRLMLKADQLLPTRTSVRKGFYMNRTVKSMLPIQGFDASGGGTAGNGAAVKVQESLNQFGDPVGQMSFMGIPIRTVDQLTITEARIT